MCVCMCVCVFSQRHEVRNSNDLLTHPSFLGQIAMKYDLQKEEELRVWIEDLTGATIGPDFQNGLKSGVILCQ